MDHIEIFKALGDETRFRIVNILHNNEFTVNEIVAILDMGQSRVSRHLKILSDTKILKVRKDGLNSYYTLANETNGAKIVKSSAFLFSQCEKIEDIEKARKVLAERKNRTRQFFNDIAHQWESLKTNILGDFDLNAEIISWIGKTNVVADLGCGSGDLIELISDRYDRIIGVDNSPKMIEISRERSRKYGNVEVRLGDIEHLPMKDKEADCAILNMVLHHLASPGNGIKEISRVLGFDKKFILVDLDCHNDESMREIYGDRWLGFKEKTINSWLKESGFIVEEKYNKEIKNGLKLSFFISRKEIDINA